MRRDIGNEVIVAIAAVGILAFVIAFAVILSLSGGTETAPTATPPAEIGAVSTLTATSSPTPSSEPTDTPSPTDTVTPSESPSATISPAPIVATDTALPPTATETALPTRRASTPVPTRTPTRTPVPPSETPTATRTSTRTPTNTPSKTPTPVPTDTPTLTPTRTPRPTETSGIQPTREMSTAQLVYPTVCVQPSGWVVYVVREGDTLLSLSRVTGVNETELRLANCLRDTDSLYAGQILYLPFDPTLIPTPLTPGSVAIRGCTDPGALISNLEADQLINRPFTVRGTASTADFWYYKLEVRPDSASVYEFISSSETQVENGTLGRIDPSDFGSGRHWLRLSVVNRTTASPQTCAIPLIFQ